MIQGPSLWGLIPLILFIVLVFKKWHPVAAIGLAVIVGAIMSGQSSISIASSIKSGMGSFLTYVGLIILSGAGLGKITEKTGVARRVIHFVMYNIGINTPTKGILGTMISSTLLVSMLGTLAGANAIIAPVVIPIVASLGLSSSVVAIIFQGAGACGLFLGPFTPPMVTLMKLTGLSYFQVLISAGIPVAIVLWVTTFFYAKKILPTSIKYDAYTENDLLGNSSKNKDDEKQNKFSLQATFAFLITLIGLIIYGIFIGGGSTFAIFVILTTAIVTGLVGRMNPNEISETFIDGTKPLVWLFFQFVLFTPFIQFSQDMGAFEALKNLLLPLVTVGGQGLLIVIATLVGVVGIPGAAVAQSMVIDGMFKSLVTSMGVSMSVWVLVLLVGSQITSFLYPEGDTLAAMGIARSKNIKNMVTFGVIATIPQIILVIIRAFLIKG